MGVPGVPSAHRIPEAARRTTLGNGMRRVVLCLAIAIISVSPVASISPHISDRVQSTPNPSDGIVSPAIGRVAQPEVASHSWPTLLGNPERTGVNPSEVTLAPSNVSNLREIWTIANNGSDFSSPIVVNGTLYYGSWNGYEYAVTASNGKFKWGTFLGTDDCSDDGQMGVSSTPAYVNGTLYLGGGDGYWYALNASTGAVDWRFYVGAPPQVNDYDWASALVYRNSLYIGVASCADNPLIRGALIQVNLTGDHTANHTFYTIPFGQIGDSIWTTPAVDPSTNTVWVTTGNEASGYPPYANAIIALNASNLNVIGSWQVPNVEGLDSDFGSTPSLITTPSGVPLVVATDKNGYTYALNRSNVTSNGSWAPIWAVYDAGGFSAAAFDGQTLYVAGDGLYAIDPNTGRILWDDYTIPWTIASPTWANGVVYVGTGSQIYAVDAETGVTLWNATVPGAGSVVAESVVLNGRLYVPSGNYSTEGNLTAYGLLLNGSGTVSAPNGWFAAANTSFAATAEGGMPPYSFQWSFGDGTSGYGPLTTHAYLATGNFTATLWINDSANDSFEENFTFLVLPPSDPMLAAQIASTSVAGALPFVISLNGSESGGAFPPYYFRWSFGDGTNASGATTSHTYFRVGQYTVTLSVSDRFGNIANTTDTVIVGPGDRYPVVFEESGLPLGTEWSVDFNDSILFGRSKSIVFQAENYTGYRYSVPGIPGVRVTPSEGIVNVSGQSTIVRVIFSAISPPSHYAIQFVESGLPSGSAWSVFLNGSETTTTSIEITFFEPNGTYSYSISAVAGYSANRTSARLVVDGLDWVMGISFLPSPAPVSPGAPSPSPGMAPSETVVILLVVSATTVLAAAALLLRPRRPKVADNQA
jgi:outer membrane protein assembly factor BamB